jgi:VWFA-related protein
MPLFNDRPHRSLFLLLICLLVFASKALGQKQSPTPQPADDVVRVKTELVQTDVTVVDKRGRFFPGLKSDQFELRVDAKPQSLAFFEQVATGSAEEEQQLGRARDGKLAPPAKLDGSRTTELDRGRLIFFFVDDVHLAGDSLTRARSVLLHFIENKMSAKDRVAIMSTSGQIGFLQQLTDNKAVLREATHRLNVKYNPETTASQVSISEVDANLIASRGDRGLFAYLVEATIKEFQGDPISAASIVKNRVSQINDQSKIAEINTLSRLESLVRSTAPLAGRKLVFFISDGFVVDTHRSNGPVVMQRVANEAARTGVVIYTLDTRANFLGAGVDASKNDYPDFSPRTAGRTLAESKMPQEPLETLADETGGRSFLNSNSLDDGVAQALSESSAYYLLAWRPDSENQRAGKSRLDVIIKGRPDLHVRMRRHSFDFKSTQTTRAINSQAGVASTSTPEAELRLALGSLYPRRDLPISVSTSFARTADKGTVLNVSMEIDTEMLGFDLAGGKEQAVVDVLGVALDDRGSFSSFKQKLEIPQEAALAKGGRFVKWTQALPMPPGLYQVRVAVRDRQSKRTGSAMGWIEIPSVESNRATRE